jgi:sulfite reductase (ferredoxin)
MAKMKESDLETTMEPIFAMFQEKKEPFEAFGDFCHRVGSEAIEQYGKSYKLGSALKP